MATDDTTHTPGTGYVLPGTKTYIVSILTALFGAAVAYVEHKAPGIATPFIEHYRTAILAWLLAGGLAATRAAIAKVEDKINAFLAAHNIPIK